MLSLKYLLDIWVEISGLDMTGAMWAEANCKACPLKNLNEITNTVIADKIEKYRIWALYC